MGEDAGPARGGAGDDAGGLGVDVPVALEDGGFVASAQQGEGGNGDVYRATDTEAETVGSHAVEQQIAVGVRAALVFRAAGLPDSDTVSDTVCDTVFDTVSADAIVFDLPGDVAEPFIDRLGIRRLQIRVQPRHAVGVGGEDHPALVEAGVDALLQRHRVHPFEDAGGDPGELGGGELLCGRQHLRLEGGQDLRGHPVGEVEHLERVPPRDAAPSQGRVEAGEFAGKPGGGGDHGRCGGGGDAQHAGGLGGHAAACEFLVVPGRPVRLRVWVVAAGLDGVTAEACDDAAVVAQPVQLGQQSHAFCVAGGECSLVLDQRVDDGADGSPGGVQGVVERCCGCGIRGGHGDSESPTTDIPGLGKPGREKSRKAVLWRSGGAGNTGPNRRLSRSRIHAGR